MRLPVLLQGWSRFGAAVLALSAVAALAVAPSFTRMRAVDRLVPGPGVTRVVPLSSYHAGLKGTPGETDVYVLEGAEPGGAVLVLGGTHGDEPAGYLAAVVLVERA